MTRKLYFKAYTGFDRSVSFPCSELEKVTYAFLTQKRVLLNDGTAIDGKYIQQISPDYERSMGWQTRGKITAEEMLDIQRAGLLDAARDRQALAGERVRSLVAGGKDISELPANLPQLT